MPSSTASETWSQTLSGWPSVTDSEVSRNERDELKDVVTSADHNLEIPPHLSEGGLVSAFMGRAHSAGRAGRRCSGPVVVSRVFGRLAEQLRLEREDVIEHAVDAAALQAMIRDHARAFEMASEQCAERAIDAGLTADLGLFQQLKAAVERELLRLVGAQIHSVPSTSTRPAVVTRVCTLLRAGRW